MVELEAYAALIDERVGLVSVPLISYRNGVRLPVREIVARGHEQGAKVFVDAYQGLGWSRSTSASWTATTWSVAR